MGTRRATIVVLGMASKKPSAGIVWMTAQYVLGFERLGFDTYYVEQHALTPTTLMRGVDDDSSALAAGFIERMMSRFGLAGRWAYQALHADGRYYGMTRERLERLFRSADLIVNLHGGTSPLPEHVETGRLVFLDTDPVKVQVELAEQTPETIALLEPHMAFFTFAENYGRPGCRLPVSGRFDFGPTRQPVLLDLWEREGPPAGRAFRTIGSWRQDQFDIRFNDENFSWSKHHEFLRFADLPRITGKEFEPALAKVDEPHRRLLEEKGWHVRDALAFTYDVDAYREFIHGSLAEFSVAKEQNVRLRTGWFSERSASFLASGLPVVVQDTAFAHVLPTGEGLLPFLTLEDAAAGVDEVCADPARHGRAAFEIAREYFAHEVVLGHILSELGVSFSATVRRKHAPELPLPASLVVTPAANHHPPELPSATVETVLRRPIPLPNGRGRSGGSPLASVVVVTRDNLPLTRMCVEAVLQTDEPPELIVVDNASGGETQAYLAELRARHPLVRVVFNSHDLKFGAAVNQGLQLATGRTLVILNNDAIVTPGWLQRLAAHLEDVSVGLVCALTNAAPQPEAQIGAPYRTYGELAEFAERRAATHSGRAFDVRVATTVCAAMGSETYERVGPLDERYSVRLFEDGDYSMRIAAAGLRVVYAEDVFVHRLGEADAARSLNDTAVFAANRRRFEHTWGSRWSVQSQRPSDVWEALVEEVKVLVDQALPDDAVVLVVNRGDEAFLELGGRVGWHFPRDESGGPAGYHPADSAAAIAHLTHLRSLGATHLVFPSMELWWLDHYRGLREHLETTHREVARTEAGVVYELVPS